MNKHVIFGLALLAAICLPAAIVKWSLIGLGVVGYVVYCQTQN